MDDTLLDGWSAMNAAWGVVCANVGERFGVDCDHMREVFRKRAAEFWKDESAVEHWRVRLVEARAVIIEEGIRLVTDALSSGLEVGPYQVQAAIAAVHDEAATAEETDWPQVVRLYEVLAELQPGPMVELNRAVAVAMVDGPEAGLAVVDSVSVLAGHHRWHAIRGQLLARAGARVEAVSELRTATPSGRPYSCSSSA